MSCSHVVIMCGTLLAGERKKCCRPCSATHHILTEHGLAAADQQLALDEPQMRAESALVARHC